MNLRRFVLWPRLFLTGHTVQHLRALSRSQWLTQDQVTAVQQQRLAAILSYAHDHVPHYRRILEQAGVVGHNGEIDAMRFAEVPFLDKRTIRKVGQDLLSDDASRLRWQYNTSGGSTGEPVRLAQDRGFHDWGRALSILFDTWTGYFLGDRKALFWGSERDLFVGHETFKVRLSRWLRNEVWFNTFRMTPDQMKHYVQKLNSFRPRQVLAYAESVDEFCRFAGRNGISLVSPYGVMTSAGTLFPEMRATIERVMRAPVFNRYGSREMGGIACECEQHKGLHVSVLTHLVEIVRSDGCPAAPGEIGEIVVTSLVNHAMPLIRYRIGDTGAWATEGCTCGRSWPLLASVTGRTADTFLTASGSQIHGEYFTHLFYFQDWVERFQVIQEARDLIRVLVVPRDCPDPAISRRAEINSITDKIKLVMGPSCTIRFEFADDIPSSPSGKYRYTVSKVAR